VAVAAAALVHGDARCEETNEEERGYITRRRARWKAWETPWPMELASLAMSWCRGREQLLR
jgi:hypothetical protein